MWYNKFVCLQKQGYARIHIDTQMCIYVWETTFQTLLQRRNPLERTML